MSLAARVVERGERVLVLGPLSAEAQAARAPLPVEVLLSGALHDTTHKDPGRARAARTIRDLKAKVQDEQVAH